MTSGPKNGIGIKSSLISLIGFAGGLLKLRPVSVVFLEGECTICFLE